MSFLFYQTHHPTTHHPKITNHSAPDNSGLQIRFGAETKHQIAEHISLTMRVGTTLASERYMDTYFGVTAAQSRTSLAGLAQYDPQGGFKDVHADLGATVDLTERWILKMGGRYARLIGDAADSPVIETENQFSGIVGLGYKFYLDH